MTDTFKKKTIEEYQEIISIEMEMRKHFEKIHWESYPTNIFLGRKSVEKK